MLHCRVVAPHTTHHGAVQVFMIMERRVMELCRIMELCRCSWSCAGVHGAVQDHGAVQVSWSAGSFGSEAKRFSAHSGGLSLQAVQVFMERKILGRVFGAEAEQFAAHGGFLSLQAEVAKFGKDHPFTALVPDLSGGIDPDDAFSRIPYEKGFHFLYHLQTIVGGPGVFEPFMKAYIAQFALKTVTTDEFKAFLLEYFAGNEALATLDWDAWLFRPGAPLALCG